MADEGLFKFILKTKEKFLDLSKFPVNMYSKILLTDSIFGFFPLAEIYQKDFSAAISEHAFFVEGLEFELALGNDLDGYLTHNYCWSENQTLETAQSTFISGTNAYVFLSYYYYIDKPQSRAFIVPISEVVKQIAMSDYGMLPTDLEMVKKTFGNNIQYQMAETTSAFINKLSERAYSKSYNKSPHYTFINCKGELYFATLDEMFEEQQPLDIIYSLQFDTEASSRDNSILRYQVLHGGLPINKENYKKKIFKRNDLSIEDNEESEIDEFIVKKGKGKFLALKEGKEINDFVDYGFVDTIEKEEYLGWVNNLYVDSALSYRMNITIHFNKEAVAGKTIELNIESSEEEKQVSPEFSGEWLILESRHYLSRNRVAYSNLIIGKSKIELDSRHKYYNDFIEV